MYLKLTNDHTASFYNNESMNAESKEFCFKFNPCHYPNSDATYCFEADIKDDLRSFLKRFGADINKIDSDNSDDSDNSNDSDNSDDSEDESIYADVAKLRFCLLQDGDVFLTIGPCS